VNKTVNKTVKETVKETVKKTVKQNDLIPSGYGREFLKVLVIGAGVALIVPLIETLLGRPTLAKKGNPHAKPPFPVEMELKPGYD
jgi:hypothetical protein